MPEQREPIWKKPLTPPTNPEHGAAFILIHGFDDDAEGVEDIADQFRSASKLPHLSWVIPNAPQNLDAMAAAWYAPVGLSAVPPSRPELAEDEDEDGLLRSQKYFESLIDTLHTEHHIPLHRIVLGGFSQGCVQALLLALTSEKYAGKLAGVVGLMGYLPLGAKRIREMRAEAGLPASVGSVPMLLSRGREDRMIPGWVWRRSLEDLGALGTEPADLQVGEYEGVGHTVNGVVLQQVMLWLEKYVPDLETGNTAV